ncbi:MAG: cyclase family protein [Gaiellaceae bacterium]
MVTAQSSALSRITSAQVQKALQLAVEGRVYDLGLEINEQMPQGLIGQFTPFSLCFRATPEKTGAQGPFQYAVETIIGTLHTSTHIDGLVHVQAENRIYGGDFVSDARDDRGWKKHGMETVPPLVGRCVMLDVAGVKGVDALQDGYEITIDDLKRSCSAQIVEVEPGDCVLVRTGKIREFYTNPAKFGGDSQPGVGGDAAVWLYEQGMAALGTDTSGIEPSPPLDWANTTHRMMLVERGVHLIENLNLDELARDGICKALFVCLPLKITGATGSWVRPVAIV